LALLVPFRVPFGPFWDPGLESFVGGPSFLGVLASFGLVHGGLGNTIQRIKTTKSGSMNFKKYSNKAQLALAGLRTFRHVAHFGVLGPFSFLKCPAGKYTSETGRAVNPTESK